MSSQVVAVVPVREGSSRIKNKNFTPFGEDPTLVHRKIRHLKNADCFSHIYISSDSPKAKQIAKECGVDFLPRDPEMCTSTPRWYEVVVHILNTVPGNPIVTWALVTGPLFERYREAVNLFLKSQETHDSLVGVKSYREYFINEEGQPFFFGFGPWHPYTNEIKPLYAINDTIFIAKKSDQLHWRYWMGRKPILFQCDPIESIDLNF